MTKILILGGTEDGLALHNSLSGETGIEAILSLAGRTASPKGLPDGTRIGGFGGPDGLADFVVENGIDILVDATHPFARIISANAVSAARKTKTPHLALVRPAWQQGAGDLWAFVANEEDAASALPPGARAFLALGAQRISAFGSRGDVFFIVRVVDAPEVPLLPIAHSVITGRGPFNFASETKIFEANRVTHLVARNSGGLGAMAKLQAARHLGLPVIMIDRPEPPPGPVVVSVEAAQGWIMDQLK